MPNYDYECKKCEKVFEVFQKMSDQPLKACPKCGGKVRRLVGGGCGLIFKGSGFYITDYKRKENKGGAAGCANAKDCKKSAAGGCN